MVYIKKIFGRAGTGKTYTLTQEIGALLDEGVSIRDIAMVTHTRIGVHVFKGRMINELNLSSNDLIHFGTMHSLSWRRQGLRSDDIFGKLQEQDFLETYYPDLIKVPDEYPPEEFYLDGADKARLSGRSKIKAMIDVDGTLSGCMIKDFDFERMRQMTGRTLGYTNYYVRDASRWSDKHDKRVLDWGRQYDDISPDEQEEFSTNFREYLVQNDLFSHARNLEEMYATKSYIPARYLFFDEFQDFSRLQYEIFLNWAAAPGVEQVTLSGDDSQTIFRFSSASAQYIINTPADEVAKLHRTFRHGKEILDNANALHKYMNVVEPVDVVPARDMRGEIICCTGDEWKEVVDFTDPDESVLVLASTGEWVRQVKKDIRELFPDVVFVNLEDTRVVDRVFGMYNVIASLERGEEVQGASRSWDDKWDSVSGLFKHSTSLPRDMFYRHAAGNLYRYVTEGGERYHASKHLSSSKSNVSDDDVEITNQHHNTPPGWREEPVGDADTSRIDESGSLRYSQRGRSHKTQQMTPGAVDTQPTMTSVLKGVKASIKRDEFPIREFYTKETFEKDFLKVPWVGRYLINSIPDIAIFPQAPDVFPAYAEPKVNKRIGTIHKAKGDEADTVLLFMSVSQPALFNIHEPDVADDVLRQFYVGKTRPRTKLIEVYDYLTYSNGEIASSPLEMIA